MFFFFGKLLETRGFSWLYQWQMVSLSYPKLNATVVELSMHGGYFPVSIAKVDMQKNIWLRDVSFDALVITFLVPSSISTVEIELHLTSSWLAPASTWVSQEFHKGFLTANIFCYKDSYPFLGFVVLMVGRLVLLRCATTPRKYIEVNRTPPPVEGSIRQIYSKLEWCHRRRYGEDNATPYSRLAMVGELF